MIFFFWNLAFNTTILIYPVFNFEKLSIYVNWSFLMNLFLNLAKMPQVRAHYASIMWIQEVAIYKR